MRTGQRSHDEHADDAHEHQRAAAGKAARTDALAVQRKASGSKPPDLMMSPAPGGADAFDFGYAGVVQKKDKPAAADTGDDATAKPLEDDNAEALLISFPDFKIETETFLGKVGGLGHAGVLLISKTGKTRYYEYGRYKTKDGTKGTVRNVSVSNVVIGADGKATPASLDKVLAQISGTPLGGSGHGGRIEAAYFQNVSFEVMEAYAQTKLKESNPQYKEYDKKRKSYELLDNNCATFAEDVITQDKDVDKPGINVHSPVNTVEEYQEEGNAKVSWDPTKKAGSRLSIGEFDETDAKVKK